MAELTDSEKIAADSGALRRQCAQRTLAKGSADRGSSVPITGALPSNTAPPNYTGLSILRQGVDSLYLNYPGSLTEQAEVQLTELKARAQSPECSEQAEAFLPFGDHTFVMSPRGRGRFPFVLSDNWYHLQLSRIAAEKMPLAYVQVASELLTRSGMDAAVAPLSLLVGQLAGKTVTPMVSRLDLCVDFVTALNFAAIPESHWVTRASKQARYYVRGRFSGLTFGQGGALSCRLYDKTLEIEKSQKTYLYELWKAQGWDEVAPVWRLEFQFNRELLTQVGIYSLEQLKTFLNALWVYGVDQWLQLKLPQSQDGNSSRWPVYPQWQQFLTARFNKGPCEPVYRVRKDSSPSDQALFINGLGSITSFMAREGIHNIEEALSRYLDQARAYHRRQSNLTGKTLNTYVREKVEQKRTRYANRQRREAQQ